MKDIIIALTIGISVALGLSTAQAQECNHQADVQEFCTPTTCINTGQFCPTPFGETGQWRIHRECLDLTDYACEGIDVDCHCTAQDNLTCPSKWDCAKVGSPSCSTWSASGCGSIQSSESSTCGGTGCN